MPLKPFITAEPELARHDLRAGPRDSDSEAALFVVLASDGLFDVMSSEEVGGFTACLSVRLPALYVCPVRVPIAMS